MQRRHLHQLRIAYAFKYRIVGCCAAGRSCAWQTLHDIILRSDELNKLQLQHSTDRTNMSGPKPFRYDKIFGDASRPESAADDPTAHPLRPATPMSQARPERSEVTAGSPRWSDAADAAQSAPVSGSPRLTDSGAQASDSPNIEPEEAPPPPPPVPLFSSATKPILDVADTHSLRLLWEAQRQTGLLGIAPEGVTLKDCAITYALQMQEVWQCKAF